MYTSDIDGGRPTRQLPEKSDTGGGRRLLRFYLKTAIVYLALSALCIVITNVYALFAHGVRSLFMDLMFLYPLLGGALIFFGLALMARLLPGRAGISRAVYNLYNSGIATLTSASMLDGVMEIAGTGTKWIGYIRIFGLVLLAAAAACQLTAALKPASKEEK